MVTAAVGSVILACESFAADPDLPREKRPHGGQILLLHTLILFIFLPLHNSAPGLAAGFGLPRPPILDDNTAGFQEVTRAWKASKIRPPVVPVLLRHRLGCVHG
jgi:hypothetical protein